MVDLTQKLEQKQNDRDELQDKYKEIESNLIRAEVLMKSLGDEEVWSLTNTCFSLTIINKNHFRLDGRKHFLTCSPRPAP